MLERVTAAGNEHCAILIRRDYNKGGVFLWRRECGWQALPLLGQGNYIRDIAFDANDQLLALHAVSGGCSVSRFDNGKWVSVCTVPASQTLVPLADGYVVTALGGQQEMTVNYVPFAAPREPVCTKLSDVNRERMLYCRLGGKVLCLPRGTWARIAGYDEGFELTSAGLQKCLAGHCIGFDFKAGTFLNCKILETTDEHLLLRPDIPDAPEIRLPVFSTYGSSFRPFRDSGGHLWMDGMRWDGRDWQAIAEKTSFPGGVWRAHERDYAQLSEDGSNWSLLNSDTPLDAFTYDSKERTYWRATSFTEKGALRLIRSTGGKEDVIRTIPYDVFPGWPSCRTSEGDWWGVDNHHVIFRLTDNGVKQYSPKGLNLFLGPRGQLWCNTEVNDYARYDPRGDTFVPDKPWDDFSLDFGKWKLSYIPLLDGSGLWCKKNGDWAPFLTPFSPHNAKVFSDPVYKDRLLVTVQGIGALEYNATLNQWARFTDSTYRANFDARGRRILSGLYLLVYDGDPWAGFKPDPKEDAAFSRLLKQLDDDGWKVREETIRALAKNFDTFRDRIIDALEDPSLSLEVRTRLKSTLPIAGAAFPAPPDLFRTKYPVLLPPK